jgi:AcrR family transcriptional regulator
MARPRSISDERILDAARACFLEHGGGAATTMIAQRLGVSHALLFQRFGTKDGLMRAALLPRSEPEWMIRMRAGPSARDAKKQLSTHATQIFEFYQALVPCIAVLRAAGVLPEMFAKKPSELPPVKARREVAAWFERATALGLARTVDPAHAADLLLGALFFRPFQQHIARVAHTRAQDRAFVEFAVDAVWSSVRPIRATREKRRSSGDA